MRRLDIPAAMAEAEAQLQAPGAPFETEEALVLGERMRVFKRRPRSLREILERSADHGEVEHLLFTDGKSERRYSFRSHARQVAELAAAFRERHGVGPGDRVAILAANCPEWLFAFWATVSLGATAVALNAWWTAAEIAYALEDCRPRLLVVDARRAARLSTKIPTLVIEEGLPRGDAEPPAVPLDEDDPAVVVYTSGTTGRPRGAMHSHRNVIGFVMLNFFHAMRMRMVSPPGEQRPPCTLVTSPLFHVSGLHGAAVTALAGGARTVWMTGRFDPALALSLVERERITGWGYTAALLHRVVHHPEAARRDLSSLHHLGGGGSPIAPALQERAREVFSAARGTFGVGYGLTECTALATLNAGEELRALPRSVGRPLPTVAIDVRDPEGRSLAEGTEGEVHVRSPLVMLGYFGDEATTREHLRPGRWLRTGDIGTLEGGRLFLASRKRDLILRGGENVYPVEIEQRLERHPQVAEAAVIGVDHEELGQEVKAIVVPIDGKSLDPAELASWVGSELAYFKIPAHWEIRRSPLPRNATGKVLKHVLAGADGGFLDES